jgi:two-component system, cell cycle sensor histidine kinase and response regulator CckA
VYLVDDEPMVLELTRLILAQEGYDLREFRNPVEALEAFKAADPKPDLIVTDYAMNEMDGIRLMQSCREERPGQKVLLVSGTVGREICSDPATGPDEFLSKPFGITQLTDLVRQLTT